MPKNQTGALSAKTKLDKDDMLEMLLAKIGSLEASSNTQATKMENQEKEIKSLKEHNARADIKMENLAQEIKGLTEQNIRLTERLGQVDKLLDEAYVQIEGHKKTINDHEKTIITLKTTVAELEDTIEEHEETIKEWKAMKKESDDQFTKLHAGVMASGMSDFANRAIIEHIRTKVLRALGFNTDSEGWPYALAQRVEDSFRAKFLEMSNSAELTSQEFTLLTTSFEAGNIVAHSLPNYKTAIMALYDFENPKTSNNENTDSTAHKFFRVAYPNEEYKRLL